jgi:hypothetical protein
MEVVTSGHAHAAEEAVEKFGDMFGQLTELLRAILSIGRSGNYKSTVQISISL